MIDKYSEIDTMEIEIEFKRQNSHGPLNYYLDKKQQLSKNQKIQIIDVEYTKEEKAQV